MTLRELIDVLEDLRENFGDDARVLLMQQESWPFEVSIAGVAVREDFQEPDGYDEDDEAEYGTFSLDYGDEPKAGCDIFLVEGRQLSYGRKDAWNAARH